MSSIESKIPIVRKARMLMWISSPLVPVIAIFYLWCGLRTGNDVFYSAFPVVIYVIIPVADFLIGIDLSNPNSTELYELERRLVYRIAVYAFIPSQMALMVFSAWIYTHYDLSFWGAVGLCLSVGTVNGVGFIAAHDLSHHKGWINQWLAKFILAPTVYGHFVVEHVRGHHLNVATFSDPTSSRMGENFWRYLVRAIVTGVASAWRIERQRLARTRSGPWHYRNDNLQAWTLTVVMFGALCIWLGPWVLLFLLFQAFYGVVLLEATNYIEHYSLLRHRLPNGSLERCTHAHAWDSNHVVCSMFIYQLQRHSDHHVHPGRSYQALQWSPSTPQLPASYVTLMVVAYIPPLWFWLMDRRVLEHFGGDLSRANLDPRHRKRLLAKYKDAQQIKPSAGDAYFMAMHAMGSDTDIIFSCDLKKSTNTKDLIKAFGTLLATWPQLQYRRSPIDSGGTWQWQTDASAHWQSEWIEARSNLLQSGHSVGSNHTHRLPQLMPMRLSECSSRQVVFRINHTFANGRAGFEWIERYFATLFGQAEDPGNAVQLINGKPPLSPLRMAWQAAKLVFASTLTRRRIGGNRSDLRQSYLRSDPQSEWSSVTRRWVIPTTQAMFMLSKSSQESFTEAFATQLANHFLSEMPSMAGISLQVAVDLHESSGVPVCSIGNHTAVVTGYFERGSTLRSQIAKFFTALRNGAAAGQGPLLSMGERSLAAMVEWFRKHLQTAIQGPPTPFMDPLVTISNAGALRGTHTQNWLVSVSLRTATPSVYLSSTTLGEVTTFEACVPAHLFDAERVMTSLNHFFEDKDHTISKTHHLTPSLVPRYFAYDIAQNFDVNWNGGNAYRSQAFNAISMLLPAGEKWIIDTVKRVIDTMPPTVRSEWNLVAKDFIAQESIHRSVHRQYNAQLLAQGLPDWANGRAQRRTQWGEHGTPLNQLASSVAYEYLTAIFATTMLKTPSWLEGATPQLTQMWRWHACEELEHKYFVHDLYVAAGGGSVRRIAWYLWSLVTFMLDAHIQLFLSLRAAGELWKFRVVLQGLKFNFGKGGMFWAVLFGSVQFLNPGFRHVEGPSDQLARQWLDKQNNLFKNLRPCGASSDVQR